MITFDVHQQVGTSIPKSFWARWLRTLERHVRKAKGSQLSIAIVGDAAIRRLNATYRGKDKITDVLSFGERQAHNGRRASPTLAPGEPTNFLGELVICYPQAKRQARALQHSLEHELSVLFVHGVLHLLGYEHHRRPAADRMRRLEDVILDR